MAGGRRPVVVVKIGGSLLGSPRLRHVLSILASQRDLDRVVVSGGGLLAEAVRQAQAIAGFGEILAHRLALDAMDQLAQILADRESALVPLCKVDQFVDVWRAGKVPIWSTAEIRDGHLAIPECWAVTSDSLAAWVAARIGASRLVIVKSVDVASAPAEALVRAGIVDEGFPRFAQQFAGEIAFVGPEADGRFAEILKPAPGPSDGAYA